MNLYFTFKVVRSVLVPFTTLLVACALFGASFETSAHAASSQMAITTPQNNSTVELNFTVKVSVPSGTQTVEYLIDKVVVGKSGQAPFSLNVTAPSAGTHTLGAVAIDRSGKTIGSDSITIQVRSSGSTPTPTPQSSPTPTPTPQSSPTPTPAPKTTGITLLEFGNTNQSNPNVSGQIYNIQWGHNSNNNTSGVEEVQGVFDWSAVDSGIAPTISAGKHVWFGLPAGTLTPAWAYTVSMIYESSYNNCGQYTVPVPWNSTFMSNWSAFIAAVGTRYSGQTLSDGSRVVTGVSSAGINDTSAETHLVGTTSNACYSANLAAVNAAGYTAALVESAFNSFTASVAAAFPGTQIFWGTIGSGFPSDSPISGTQFGPVETTFMSNNPTIWAQFDGCSTSGCAITGLNSYQESMPLTNSTDVHNELVAISALHPKVFQMYSQSIQNASSSDLAAFVAGTL